MPTKVTCCDFADVPMVGMFRHEMCECFSSTSPYRFLVKFTDSSAKRCTRSGRIMPGSMSIPFDAHEPVELLEHPLDAEFVRHLGDITAKMDRIRHAVENMIDGNRVASETEVMFARHISTLLDSALQYAEA